MNEYTPSALTDSISLLFLGLGTKPKLEKALPASCRASLSIWHQRLAHLNQRTILKMSSQQMVSGLDILEPNLPSHTPCEGCILGKMHRTPFSKGRTRATEVGELIHSDVCGPMQIATPGRLTNLLYSIIMILKLIRNNFRRIPIFRHLQR